MKSCQSRHEEFIAPADSWGTGFNPQDGLPPVTASKSKITFDDLPKTFSACHPQDGSSVSDHMSNCSILRSSTPLGFRVVSDNEALMVEREHATLFEMQSTLPEELRETTLDGGHETASDSSSLSDEVLTNLEIIQHVWFTHKNDPDLSFRSLLLSFLEYSKNYKIQKKDQNYITSQLYVAFVDQEKHKNIEKITKFQKQSFASHLITPEYVDACSNFNVQNDLYRSIRAFLSGKVAISHGMVNQIQISLMRLPYVATSFSRAMLSAEQLSGLSEVSNLSDRNAKDIEFILNDFLNVDTPPVLRAVIDDTIRVLRNRIRLHNVLTDLNTHVQSGFTVEPVVRSQARNDFDTVVDDFEPECSTQMFKAISSVVSAVGNSGETVESIQSLTKSAETLVPRLHDLIDTIESSSVGVDQLTNAGADAFKSIDGSFSMLNAAPESLQKFFLESVSTYGSILIPLLTVVLCIHYQHTRSESIRLFLTFILTCAVIYPFSAQVSSVIRSFTTSESSVQSGSLLTSLAVLAYTSVGIDCSDNEKMIKDFVNVLQKIPRASDGFDKVLDSLRTLAGYLLRFTSRNVSDAVFSLCCGDQDTDFTAFTADVDKISLESRTGLQITQKNRCRINDLIHKGEVLLVNMSRLKKNLEGSYISRLITDLKKIQAALSDKADGKPPVRREPVGFLLRGASGVGKSSAMEILYKSILYKVLPKDDYSAFEQDHRNALYVRTTQSFWEGYRNTTEIVFFDDFMQIRDVVGGASQASEVIALVNVAPCPLDMAFEQKGTVFAEPGFVFATTNSTRFRSEAIESPGALARRFHIQYKVTVKPEFALPDGRYRVEKGQSVDVSHWDFHVQKSDSHGMVEDTGVTHTFDQVVAEILAQYELHGEKRNQMVEATSLYMQKMKASTLGWDDLPDEPLVDMTPCDNLRTVKDVYDSLTGLDWSYNSVYEQLEIAKKLDVLEKSKAWFKQRLECGTSFFEKHFDPRLPPKDLGINVSLLSSAANSMTNPFFVKLKLFMSFLRDNALLVSAVVAAGGLFAVHRSIRNETATNTSQSSVDGRNAVPQKHFINQRQPRLSDLRASDVQINSDQIEIGVSQIRNHYYSVSSDFSSSAAGYATSIGGKFFMMPNHFLHEIHATHKQAGRSQKEIEALNIIFTKIVPENNPDPEDVIKIPFGVLRDQANDDLHAQDCLVFILPCRDKPKLLQHFMTNEQKASLSFNVMFKVSGSLVGPTVEKHFRDGVPIHNLWANSKSGPLSFEQVIKYYLNTTSGDCGLLTLGTEKYVGKIMTMHSAGNSMYGFGGILTREMLQAVVDKMQGKQPVVEVIDSLRLIKPSHSVNKKSTLVLTQSACMPCEVKTAPADLSQEAYDIAISKYLEGVYVSADLKLVEACASQLLDDLVFESREARPRVFEFEEACFGIPDCNFEALSASTSAGFPFNNMGYKGKTKYFKDGKFTTRAPELADCVQRTIDAAAEGHLVPIIVQDHLKDERRPLAKVKLKSTRLISASPLHSTIAFRMYFGAFAEFLNSNKIANGCAMGVNPYSTDVDGLVQTLLQKALDPNSCRFGAGDYSGFDRSEVPEIHQIIYRIIEKWYGDCDPADALVRATLWRSVSSSLHMWKDKVTEWKTSLPSGHPLTTIINCMYNLLAFRYCWLRLHDNNLGCLPAFKHHIYVIVLGDDNLFAVTPSYEKVFTELNISPFMAELGLSYTNDKKTVHTDGLRTLWEVSFLKRTFRPHDTLSNAWLMPLDLQVVLETTCWSKAGDTMNIARSNADFALRELTLHGEEVFNVYSRKIALHHQDLGSGWKPAVSSYSVLKDIVRQSAGFL
jgi:hypothetical protein